MASSTCSPRESAHPLEVRGPATQSPKLISSAGVLGLPTGVTACLFDLDGVLTQTAKVHSAAWKQMFDDYLRERARRTDEAFVPFDPIGEYDQYVDGKPRYDGVRAFLASRGVELAEGDPSDTPEAETIDGLGNRKNEIVLRTDPRAGCAAV